MNRERIPNLNQDISNCAGCGKTEPKTKKGVWIYKKRNGDELCCGCIEKKRLIDSNCFNCGKDLNINSEYLHQHTFPRKSGNKWEDVWESSYCVNCVPSLDEKISDSTNRERLAVRGDIWERDSKEHNHYGKDEFNIGTCHKCNIGHRDTDVCYCISPKGGLEWTERTVYKFCLDCWKTEEKHYRYIANNRNNIVYKLDRREWPKLSDSRYYFENNQWISLETGKTDPDLKQQTPNIWRELSTQEVLNDPWLSKEIDKFFGLNSQSPKNNSTVLVKNPTLQEKKAFGNLINHFTGSTVKQIALNSEGNLVVEYVLPPQGKFSEQTVWVSKHSEEIANDSELSSVRNYLQSNQRQSINQQELNALLANSNSSSIPNGTPNNNNLGRNLAIGASVLLVSGLLIGLLVKSRKLRKH